MNYKKILLALKKASKSILKAFPTIIGMILLISLVTQLFGQELYLKVFSNNMWIDPIIGSGIGSILAGNPLTSFVIAGELQTLGISLIAITAFLVSWVTVGFIQLPAETIHLGKKFTITRNVLAFISSIIVAIITTAVVSLF